MFLKGAGAAIFALGDVEDHHVSMELRGGIAIDRPGRVMLEFGCDELTGRFGGAVATEPGLRVAFQFRQSDGDSLRVRCADTVITSDQGSQRDGFGRGEGGVPPGPVLDGSGGLAISIDVFEGLAMLDKLLARLRMLSFRQPLKFNLANGPAEPEFLGQAPLPLSLHLPALAPVALIGRSEFQRVVVLEFGG